MTTESLVPVLHDESTVLTSGVQLSSSISIAQSSPFSDTQLSAATSSFSEDSQRVGERITEGGCENREMSHDELCPHRALDVVQHLPRPSDMAEGHFTWGPDEVSSEQFIRTINAAYDEVVHWKRSIFLFRLGRREKHLLKLGSFGLRW